MISRLALIPVIPLVALVLALSACGDSESDSATVTETETVSASTTTGEPTDSTTSTETTEEGGSPSPDDVVVKVPTGFTSPSGNIGCNIARESVRCDIGDHDWEPPPAPADCPVDFGPGIQLGAGAAPDFVCAGDTILDAGEPIPYGQSISSGLLRCESEESGMTCRDVETGRGFSLAKQGYELF